MKIVNVVLVSLMAFGLMTGCGGSGSGSSSKETDSSVGAKVGKEACDCFSKVDDNSILEELGDLKDLDEETLASMKKEMKAMGCLQTLLEKYAEYFDENQTFKDPQNDKDFVAALKECNPEFAKRFEE